jgi:hypothetical protein
MRSVFSVSLCLFIATGTITAQAPNATQTPSATPASGAAQTGICGQTGQTLPCVNQPTEGDTQVTGQLKTAPTATTSVTASVSLDGGKTVVASDEIKSVDVKTFSIPVPALTTSNTVVVTIGTDPALPGVKVAAKEGSVFTLGLVGVNATGGGSSGPSQQYFVAFDILTPIAWANGTAERKHPLEHRLWVWGEPRIASLPSANTSALSTISSPSGLSTGAGSQTIGGITQSFEFQGGLEFTLNKRGAWNGTQFGSSTNAARTSLSLILGGGIITPFDTSAPTAEYSLNNNLGADFTQNPSLGILYPQLGAALCSYGFAGGTISGTNSGVTCPTTAPSTKPTSVAFVVQNRSRFYRDYYAGMRLRTFYFTGNCPDPSSRDALNAKTSDPSVPPGSDPQSGCKLQPIYPGTFDIRLGQDESVSQRFSGVVATLAGTFPLPGTKGTVRVFGSVYLGLKRNKFTNPLVLVPATTVATLDQPTVVVQNIAATDQDYYRLGLGVDLVPIISKWMTAVKQ